MCDANKIILIECQSGHLDVARYMLEIGDDLESRAQHLNRTRLHLVSRHGHLKLVEFLLDKEAKMHISGLVCSWLPIKDIAKRWTC